MPMIKAFYTAALAVSLAMTYTPLVYAKDEPLRLQPSSAWTVSYQDDSCRMGRKFGTGDDEVFVLFIRNMSVDSFRMIFIGKPVEIRNDSRPVKFRFGPNEAEQESSFFTGDYGKGNPAVILRGQPRIAPFTETQLKMLDERKPEDQNIILPIEPEREAAVEWIWFDLPFKESIILETGSLGKPFEAMRTCTDELMTHWGIDVEKHKNRTRFVKPLSNPGTWIKSSDYPSKMLNRGAQAIIQFRLSVDASGKATDCHIQEATRDKEFDSAACKALMKRAEFQPALDADGKPMASYYINTVVFSMGG